MSVYLRRNKVFESGTSPSKAAMQTTEARATTNGGVTVDFDANVENIREVSRDLGYNILQDASFVYVPSSYGESKNFVQNPSIRNTVKFSQELDNITFWELSNVTVSTNTINAPDGTLTADKVQETAAFGLHYVQSTISQNVTKKIGDVTTYTVFLKSAERTNVSFHLNEAGSAFLYCNFNLATGSIGTSSGTTNNTIVSVGGGWWKCSVTRLTTFAGGTYYSVISTTGDEQISYTGTAGYGFYVGGFQVEQSPIATPYQRTTDGIADFTFTRATTSTVTNKLGVIEDSCYNYISQSETLNVVPWTLFNTTVSANQTLAPNGALTADKIVESNTNASHQLYQVFTTGFSSINTTFTFSVYMKAAGRTQGYFQVSNQSLSFQQSTVIDLTNGTYVNGSPGVSVTDVGNGWYLLSKSYNSNNGFGFLIGPALAGSPTYLGNGVDGIYAWGAQVVQGSTPRPYLRTTNRLNVPKLDYSRSLLEPSLLIEPQSTNLLLNSATATTQNVTVTAVPYTLSAYGTGTYTLSGAYSGVFTASGTTSQRTVMTFTPSAGTLTLTAAGNMVMVQLE